MQNTRSPGKEPSHFSRRPCRSGPPLYLATRCISDLVFVDTNIPVYAHDADAGPQREYAIKTLRQLWELNTGRVSIQVLLEFYVNVTHKLKTPLACATAREILDAYWRVGT